MREDRETNGTMTLLHPEGETPRGDDAGSSAAPLPASTSASPGWLVEATSFVGREAELEQLGSHVDRGARLLTILGAAGLGKTRLARRFGRLMLQTGMDVWFCDLMPASSVDDMLGALSRCLQVSLARGTTAEESAALLGHAIATRGRGLFVLDNVEQLVDHAESTIGRWLTMAPSALFLVTSRQTLGLEAEVRFELGALSAEQGATLFQHRMRQVRDLPLDAEQSLVLEIVRRLDGIPLAIELAAARTSVMLPSQILERMSNRFGLLRTSRRDAPARHATLELAIDWSWNNLSPWEQSALAQCVVFRGGFSVEAAEAVVDLSAFAKAPAVVDVVEALLERSLIHSSASRESHSRVRLGLYESIREYAARKLDEPMERLATMRHARFYVKLAEGAAEAAEAPAWKEALAQLGREFDNIAAIVSRRDVEPDLSCRAMLALDALLSKRGPLPVRMRLLGEIAPALRRLDPGLEVRYLYALARAKGEHGRLVDAQRDLERALEIAGQAGDALFQGKILATLGDLTFDCGRFAEAAIHYQGAAAAARISGDQSLTAVALLGDPFAWETQRLDEALAHVVRAGDVQRRIRLLYHLGIRAVFRAEVTVSLAYFEQAWNLAQEFDESLAEVHMRWLAASMRQLLGQFEAAAAIHEEVAAILRETCNRRHLGLLLAISATLRCAEWHLTEARALVEESLSVCSETGEIYAEALALALLAGLEALEGRLLIAETHLEAARALACSIDVEGLSMKLGPGVSILEAVVELGRARQAEGCGDEDQALRSLAKAAERLARLPTMRPGSSTFISLLTGPVLERAMVEYRSGRFKEATPSSAEPSQLVAGPPSVDLELGPQAVWFRARGGPRVDLRAHLVQRRLLLVLAMHRTKAPGRSLSAAELISAAWPGERILFKAGTNRLRNAVAVLREKGLRGLLRTMDDGYLLDLCVSLRFIAEQPDGEGDAGAPGAR